MKRLTMTEDIARAAAWDAGARSAAAGLRTIWSREDYNAAVAEFNRLWPPRRKAPHLHHLCGEVCFPPGPSQ